MAHPSKLKNTDIRHVSNSIALDSLLLPYIALVLAYDNMAVAVPDLSSI